MNLPSRRWLVALLTPAAAAGGQLFTQGKRVDDIVSRLAKLEEHAQRMGERLAALEAAAGQRSAVSGQRVCP